MMKPAMQQSAAQQQQQQQQQQQILQSLLQAQLAAPKRPGPAKPKKRTAVPTQLVPESAAVVAIGEHERKVDLLLKRRRLEVQAVTTPEAPVRKKVRIYITHKHAHQPDGHGGGDGSGEPPQWSLHLSGRVDPDAPADPVAAALAALQGGQMGAQQAAAAAKQGSAAHPFTSLWRRITVTLRYRRQQRQQGQQQHDAGVVSGQADAEDEEVIVWEKSRHKGVHREELQLLRMGSTPVHVTVKLEPDNTPQRFKLPAQLAHYLGTSYDARHNASKAVDRIMLQGQMHEPGKPGRLVPNAVLAQVLGRQPGEAFDRIELADVVAGALDPVEPFVLQYEVADFSSPPPCGATHCFDLTVDMPTKLAERAHPALERLMAEMEKELDEPDRELQQALAALAEARRRRTLLLGFSQDPAAFVDAVMATQARDLRAATGMGAVQNQRQVFETPRRSEAFSGGWVEEAVLKHLLRKRQESQQATLQQQQARQQQALQQILLVQQQQQAGAPASASMMAAGLQGAALQKPMVGGLSMQQPMMQAPGAAMLQQQASQQLLQHQMQQQQMQQQQMQQQQMQQMQQMQQ